MRLKDGFNIDEQQYNILKFSVHRQVHFQVYCLQLVGDCAILRNYKLGTLSSAFLTTLSYQSSEHCALCLKRISLRRMLCIELKHTLAVYIIFIQWSSESPTLATDSENSIRADEKKKDERDINWFNITLTLAHSKIQLQEKKP